MKEYYHTRNIEELSIGDFILSGGETASFVVLDSILKIITWVSWEMKSQKMMRAFENGLLEYPQYTKPQIWEEKSVQMCFYQEITTKLKTGVYHNQRL